MKNIIYISLIQNLERLLEWLDKRGQFSTEGGEFLTVTNARAALNNALKNPPTTPRVEIVVHGGLVSDVRSDVPVDIRVVDYDNDGADPERIEQDTAGDDCVVSEYPASVEPFMINRASGGHVPDRFVLLDRVMFETGESDEQDSIRG